MSKPLQVLIIEDSEADALLLLRELGRSDYEVTFERVETRDDLIAKLDAPWDVILSDSSMPNFSGSAALQLVRERGLEVPFIIVSGTIGEDAAVQLLQAGASDCVTKDRIARLVPAIERSLREAQEHQQRRRAEEALRQSEERFAKAFRATPIGLTISAFTDNRFIDANDRTAEILGYSREELLGKTALELGIWVHPQDRDRAGQILTQGQAVRSMETQFRTRSGEIRDALISIDIIELAGERCVLSMVDDITERKRAERARAHLAAIIESSSDAIMSSTLDGFITSWNAAAERMYGYTSDEAIGKPTSFLLPYDRGNEEADMLGQLAAEQPKQSFETVRIRKDGTPIQISLTISPIRDRNGSIVGASTIARDMSERKLAEEALRNHNARLEMIHSIDHAILAAQSSQAIAQAALQHIQPLVPCHRASVNTYDFDKSEATVVATTAAWGTALGAGVSFPVTPSEPVEVLRQGRVFSAEDLLSRTPLLLEEEVLSAEGIRSYIAIPLMVRGALIGSLTLGSEQAHAFLPDHMSIAHEVANQLAIALENARLLETERRHRSELEALRQASLHLTTNLELQPVLRAILDHAIELMAADDTHIFLFDGTQLTFGAAIWGGSHQDTPYAEPRPDGLTYTVAHSAEMIVIPYVNSHLLYRDWRWGGSIVGLPLCVGARVNGVMTMAFARPHSFQDHELRVLELLADQAAIAIQNAQLYEEVQHYAEELEQRVTERTAQLRQTKEHVEAILNNSSDAIIFARQDSVIQQINSAFVELLGYEADDVFGKPLTLLAGPEQFEPLTEALRGVEHTKKSRRVEITAYRRDGSTFDADVALSPVENAHTWGIVCSLRDITQRKRAEEELRSALEKEKEVSDLKSRFTSMVSHEFRTPLATIQTSSDLLKSYSQRMTDEQKLEYLNTIQAQVKRLTELLEDILIIGRADTVGLQFEPKRMDVDAFCHKLAAEMELSAADSHTIQVSSRGECGNVLLDEKLLQRILTNLISNALKYSPQGGSVFVSLSCDREATVILVKDQGIGIPEGDRVQLFEAFHRAKNVSTISGTGLGLSIVKRAVELHGGSIQFESELGLGTTFTVTIPTVEPQD